MSAATVILTITAALLHRIMLAHSAARAFMDVERTSLRLANTFRNDVHSAIAATTTGPTSTEGPFLRLELPAGQQLEYRRQQGAILRILQDGNRTAAREAFNFPPDVEVAAKKDGSRLLALSINARTASAASEDRGSSPAAHAIPVNLRIEAVLNRDSLYATAMSEGGGP